MPESRAYAIIPGHQANITVQRGGAPGGPTRDPTPKILGGPKLDPDKSTTRDVRSIFLCSLHRYIDPTSDCDGSVKKLVGGVYKGEVDCIFSQYSLSNTNNMASTTPQNVFFSSRGLKLAGHLYQPPSGAPNRNGAAIVICHPWTSIKEQSPANYARVLAPAGFICLTYDAAYQGESEGEPRHLEDPYQRVEDIKCAVTYLTSLEQVDSDKIGVFGICASGGYAPFAAQTDLRIKACATAAAVCSGTMARRGFDKDSSNMTILKTQLEAAAADRNSDITGKKVPIVHMLPEKYSDLPDDYPESFRDLASYYRTPRGFMKGRTERRSLPPELGYHGQL
ncbi:hypothetical protein NM208_g14870 [Fusarium decemcellulare]|uniref:Uncharacterized protein n=1 Tax=Fusarium decemcellulare TaxID=57161 RepID=A0ACC1RGI7_9HYPO|nr:hypothetical protein NM208_g14870 [Fusarium decemcellulare]